MLKNIPHILYGLFSICFYHFDGDVKGVHRQRANPCYMCVKGQKQVVLWGYPPCSWNACVVPIDGFRTQYQILYGETCWLCVGVNTCVS